MKQILHLLIYLLIGSFIFSQECEECVCEEPENVWFKVSYNENHRYGEILTIDMSAGAALYDESYIYLLVLEKNTGEELVIMFPIGYWSMKTVEKSKELPEEEVFASFYQDYKLLIEQKTFGKLATQLNYEKNGFKSIL